jgi:hypothetical protein
MIPKISHIDVSSVPSHSFVRPCFVVISNIASGRDSLVVYLCPKYFVHLRNLQRHLRVRTGEKSHGCSHCVMSFSQLGALKQHERAHSVKKFSVVHSVLSLLPKKLTCRDILKSTILFQVYIKLIYPVRWQNH